ncbi:hypothetical protein [Aquicoccus sp.]|uniref:hypothetical protein n=1 Tax=Aquicoccus sp. TaxID=2055851 RepID=UPI003569E262
MPKLSKGQVDSICEPGFHGDGIGKAEFIAMRRARDSTLTLPARMLAAFQVNIRGGCVPEVEADGHSYLKIPVGNFKPP